MFKKQNTEPTNPPAEAKDEIVFLIFKINKDKTSGETKLELIKKIKKGGKLKEGSENDKTTFENYLTFDIFTNEKLTWSTIIEHPLYKSMEVLSEDKTLETKAVSLDSAEFFTRVQIKGKNCKLKISETLKDKSIKELITITL